MATYIERNDTVGENKSIFVGLAMLNQNRSFGVSPMSSLDFSSIFPVSFLNRFVLRSSSTGAYVSRSSKIPITVVIPAAIVTIQKFHLHPKYFEMKPPAIGPTMGPNVGPRTQMDIALAL